MCLLPKVVDKEAGADCNRVLKSASTSRARSAALKQRFQGGAVDEVSFLGAAAAHLHLLLDCIADVLDIFYPSPDHFLLEYSCCAYFDINTLLLLSITELSADLRVRTAHSGLKKRCRSGSCQSVCLLLHPTFQGGGSISDLFDIEPPEHSCPGVVAIVIEMFDIVQGRSWARLPR